MTSPRSRLLPLALLLAAGCGDEGATPTYVGRAGGDAALGIVADGGLVTAYLCGGRDTFASLTRWFHGAVGPDGKLSLVSGDATLTGDLGSLQGEIVTGDGTTLAWTVTPASGGAGIYAADGACRTGAIVGDLDGDGQARLQGTWCDGEGRFAQVTPLQPVYAPAERIDVEAQTAPVQRLQVVRVSRP